MKRFAFLGLLVVLVGGCSEKIDNKSAELPKGQKRASKDKVDPQSANPELDGLPKQEDQPAPK